jgi:hypothetical protein
MLMEKSQLEELRKYAKPNLKDIKVIENQSDEPTKVKEKKKKYKKMQPQSKEEDNSNKKR